MFRTRILIGAEQDEAEEIPVVTEERTGISVQGLTTSSTSMVQKAAFE